MNRELKVDGVSALRVVDVTDVLARRGPNVGWTICRIWSRVKELYVGDNPSRESYSILYIHSCWLVPAETLSSGSE